jgi:hypothetical protein
MEYVYVALGAFAAGVVVTWLYKSVAQSKIQAELNALKGSATKVIGKL